MTIIATLAILLTFQSMWLSLLNWLSRYDWRTALISTILQTLIVAPLVSVVVTTRQKASERKQRVRMIPQLMWGTFPIKLSMETIVEGPDGDFVRGGLEMFARQFELQTERIYEPNALGFYLGHPRFLSGVLKERVTQQCDYVDGLLDLFAPHFRTKDAVNAQRMRSALREVEKAVGKVEEGVSLLEATIGSTSKFLAHLKSVDAKPDAAGVEEGGSTRDSVRKQAAGRMSKQSRDLAKQFDRLPKTLDNVAASAIAVIEGFYDDRTSYTKIIGGLEKEKWFREEQAHLATLERAAGDSSAEVTRESSIDHPETAEQIVGRERRDRVSQLDSSGDA